MINQLLSRLYNKLKPTAKAAKSYPVIYNANAAEESNYTKRALLIYVVERPEPCSSEPRAERAACRAVSRALARLGVVPGGAGWTTEWARAAGGKGRVIFL